MLKISRKPTENIRAVAQLCLLLSVAFAGVQQCALAQPTNLDIIVQRDSLAPPTAAEIELFWDGGVGPNWAWRIEVDGIEDHIFEGTNQASDCDVPDALINCRSGRFMVPLNFAEIVTIRAGVSDSELEVASAVRRVRMGTNESFWIDSVTPARIEPGANGMFTCDSDNADDPPWITLSGDDRSFPLIDVFRDDRVSLPDSLVTWDITPDPENPAAEILYIIDRINQTDEFDALAFPLQYGSIQVDTRVLPEPPIAPLRPGRLYQIRLTGEPFPCEFGSGSPQISFMLNPPAPGDPVFGRGPADEDDFDYSDPEFLKFLESIAANQVSTVFAQQEAIAGCMDEQLGLQVLIILTAGTELGKALPLSSDTAAQSVFLFLSGPENLDRLRAFCSDQLSFGTTTLGGESLAEKAVSTTDFDLEILSGSSRITLAEPTLLNEIRTAHAAVIVSDATLEIAQTADAQRSAIGSPDSALVVTPNNPALPETTVPPGFFVILSDTSISDPTEFAMFADGFE